MQGLSALAPRMEAKVAAKVSGQAAAILVQAMNETKDPQALNWPRRVCRRWCPGWKPRDAATMSRLAATALVPAMKDAAQPDIVFLLATDLPVLTARMERKDATTVNTQALTTILQGYQGHQGQRSLDYAGVEFV